MHFYLWFLKKLKHFCGHFKVSWAVPAMPNGKVTLYRKGRRVGLEELWTSGKLGPHPDFWTMSFRSPDQSLHLSRPLSPQLLEGWNSTVSRLSTGLPQWLSSGESTCNKAEDLSSVPESGRPLGGGHSKPIQSSCLISLMNRGAWWAP